MGSQRGVGSGGGVVRHWIDAARRQVFGREMGGLGKGHRQNLALSEEGGKLGAGKTFTEKKIDPKEKAKGDKSKIAKENVKKHWNVKHKNRTRSKIRSTG